VVSEAAVRRVGLLGALGLILLATGCSPAIRLQHPDGRAAECGGSYSFGYYAFAANQRDQACVADYQRQGYERTR
jgi:hypothetical protein